MSRQPGRREGGWPGEHGPQVGSASPGLPHSQEPRVEDPSAEAGAPACAPQGPPALSPASHCLSVWESQQGPMCLMTAFPFCGLRSHVAMPRSHEDTGLSRGRPSWSFAHCPSGFPDQAASWGGGDNRLHTPDLGQLEASRLRWSPWAGLCGHSVPKADDLGSQVHQDQRLGTDVAPQLAWHWVPAHLQRATAHPILTPAHPGWR